MTTGQSTRNGGKGDPPMTDTIDPVAPDENPGSTSVTDTAAPDSAVAPDELVVLAPDVLAESLPDYLQAWWKRIRGGESGALPIIIGLIVISIFFQAQSSAFLTSTNIVNLFVQSTFIILLGMAELYALLFFGDIDLSVGFVGGGGGDHHRRPGLRPPTTGRGGSGVIVGMLVAGAIGIFQGTLITRLRLPSFVVTLAGLLGFQGVLIFLFDTDKGAVGGVITVSNNVIDDLVSGTMTPAAGWILLVVLVGLYAIITVVRTSRRRAAGAHRAAPQHHARSPSAAVGVAGAVLVYICNLQPGHRCRPRRGRPVGHPVRPGRPRGRSRSCSPAPGSGATSTPSAPAPRRPGGPASTWRGSGPSRSPSAASPPAWRPWSTPPASAPSRSASTAARTCSTPSPPRSSAGPASSAGYGKPIHPLLGGLVIATLTNGLALLNITHGRDRRRHRRRPPRRRGRRLDTPAPRPLGRRG